MKTLAVIYANESNIWDNQKKDFYYFRNERVSIDELSFALPIEEAEKILSLINEERRNEGVEEAYIVELPDFENE